MGIAYKSVGPSVCGPLINGKRLAMVAYSMFSPAVSAMNAQSLAFQNISDNIANSTTRKSGQIIASTTIPINGMWI